MRAEPSDLLERRYPPIWGELPRRKSFHALKTDILNYADQVSDFHSSEHIFDALDIIARTLSAERLGRCTSADGI